MSEAKTWPGTEAETKFAEYLVRTAGAHFVTVNRRGVGELLGVRIPGQTFVVQELMDAANTTLEALQRDNERLQAELERTERNRDMWKGQVERQAKQIEDFRSETKRLQVGVYVETLPAVHLIRVFADDMNERNWDDKRAYIKQQADRILTALASTGGEDHGN